jgi:hypothetical protein
VHSPHPCPRCYISKHLQLNLSTSILFLTIFTLIQDEYSRMPTRQSKETGPPMIMKQTWQALKFVTISSPDEIEDPVKQRAIRLKARRRDNGSKLSSRKPFQVTFDIDTPSGDILAGPEIPQWDARRRTRITYLKRKRSARNQMMRFLLLISCGLSALAVDLSFHPPFLVR